MIVFSMIGVEKKVLQFPMLFPLHNMRNNWLGWARENNVVLHTSYTTALFACVGCEDVRCRRCVGLWVVGGREYVLRWDMEMYFNW